MRGIYYSHAKFRHVKNAPHDPKKEQNGLLWEYVDCTGFLWQSLGKKKKRTFSLSEDKVLNQNALSSFTQGLPHSKKFMRVAEKGEVLTSTRLDLPHPLTHPKMIPLKNRQQVGTISSNVLVLHPRETKPT